MRRRLVTPRGRDGLTITVTLCAVWDLLSLVLTVLAIDCKSSKLVRSVEGTDGNQATIVEIESFID